jgi:hypothetical protein
LSSVLVWSLTMQFSPIAFAADGGTVAPVQDESSQAEIHADGSTKIEEEILASEYHLRSKHGTELDGADAEWQAPNRAQGFRSHFNGKGLRIVPQQREAPSWELGLSLLGYGRGSDVRPVMQASATASGARIEYARGSLAEWYVNDPAGLSTFRVRGERRPTQKGSGPPSSSSSWRATSRPGSTLKAGRSTSPPSPADWRSYD